MFKDKKIRFHKKKKWWNQNTTNCIKFEEHWFSENWGKGKNNH